MQKKKLRSHFIGTGRWLTWSSRQTTRQSTSLWIGSPVTSPSWGSEGFDLLIDLQASFCKGDAHLSMLHRIGYPVHWVHWGEVSNWTSQQWTRDGLVDNDYSPAITQVRPATDSLHLQEDAGGYFSTWRRSWSWLLPEACREHSCSRSPRTLFMKDLKQLTLDRLIRVAGE